MLPAAAAAVLAGEATGGMLDVELLLVLPEVERLFRLELRKWPTMSLLSAARPSVVAVPYWLPDLWPCFELPVDEFRPSRVTTAPIFVISVCAIEVESINTQGLLRSARCGCKIIALLSMG